MKVALVFVEVSPGAELLPADPDQILAGPAGGQTHHWVPLEGTHKNGWW